MCWLFYYDKIPGQLFNNQMKIAKTKMSKHEHMANKSQETPTNNVIKQKLW
jgi:hypothetical protein